MKLVKFLVIGFNADMRPLKSIAILYMHKASAIEEDKENTIKNSSRA